MRRTNKKFKAMVKKGTVVACASTMILSNMSILYAAELTVPATGIATVSTEATSTGVSLADEKVLEEGTYTVPVSMKNMSQLDKNSMAAGSMEDNATVVVADGKAKITLSFKTIYVMTCYGNLESLKYFDSKADAISADADTLGHDATIVSYREDGKYSEFGGSNLQENLKRPKDISFTLPYTDNKYVYVSMEVDIMKALGMTSTEAAIEIDYDNAVEIVKKNTLESKISEAEKFINDNYTSESLSALKTEIANAKAMDSDETVTQRQVNDQITALDQVMKNMVLKNADYSAVDQAIASVPLDLSGYTTQSVAALNAAINAVVRDKNITEQSQVNTMAQNISSAVKALTKAQAMESVLDKTNLKNGTYNTDVYLWNASLDKESMAASSILKNAKIIVKDGVYRMYINTKEMTFGNITACLQELKIYQKDGTVVNAVVEERNNNGDPTCFSFELPSTDEYIRVAVNPHVAMMGNMDIDARIKVDYSTLEFAGDSSVVDDVMNNDQNQSDGKQDTQDQMKPEQETPVQDDQEQTESERHNEEQKLMDSKETAPKTGDTANSGTAAGTVVVSASTLLYFILKRFRSR